MSKRFLSDRDFVKEYEKATNIPNILSTTTKFCFLILVSIYFFILIVSNIRIPFFPPDTPKEVALFSFHIVFLIAVLSPFVFIFVHIIKEEYINDFKRYKAAKKRKKNFLAEIGISMKEATRRYKFLLEEAIYVQSLQEVCKLNPHTRSGQKEMIMNWYKFKDSSLVEYLLNNEYKETDFNIYAGHFGVNDVSERKCFANLLFKLAILEDGIHNDEWNTIMTILPKLNFNDNYIDFVFKKRYGPLRTESEYSSNNESTSTEEKNVNLLKPYYDLLGLEVGASDEEIKKAYHNLALQYHPDMRKNSGRTKECEDMMAKINEAYEKIRG